jgi:primosomal protein N'
MFRISSKNEREGLALAREVRNRVEKAGSKVVTERGQLRVLGPSPSPMYRVKGRYRWQVLVKSIDHGLMSRLLRTLQLDSLRSELQKKRSSSKVVLDRDPVSML